MQVPQTGPNIRERQRLIAHYKSVLAELDRIPAHRREDECADVRARACQIAIDELEGRRPVPDQPIPDALEELMRESGSS